MKNLTLAMLLGVPLGAVAQTDEISYNFLDIAYVETELDVSGPNIDGSGIAVAGSVEIRDHLHVAASFLSSEYDSTDTDELDKSLGLGFHFTPGNRFSAFAQVGFVDFDFDLVGVNSSDDGYYASFGLRFVPAPGYEIRGDLTHVDLDDSGSDSHGSVAGDISLTDVVALTIGYSEDDDVEVLSLGLRFYFGKESSRGRRR